MSDLRNELAKLLEGTELARLHMAEATLARYDLVPKGSVVVPPDDNVESLAIHRARAAQDAALVSPRDMLNMVMRDIDEGTVSPDFICICLHKRATGAASGLSNIVLAGTHNLLDIVGLLEIAKDLAFKHVEPLDRPGVSP